MANHPYYPTTLNIPNYVPNERSPLQISMISNGSMLVMVIISIFLAKWSKTTTSIPRFAWFVVGGLLHVLFEGYWLLNKDIIPGHNGVLAELWKEYAHGDSRYMVADELLLTLEIISVFIWGPLCFIAAYYIWRGSPKQYLFQLIASMSHLFTCSLYYIMDLPEAKHCDPHPFYFWIYFMSFNAPWIVVPFTLVIQSCKKISQALLAKDKSQ